VRGGAFGVLVGDDALTGGAVGEQGRENGASSSFRSTTPVLSNR
jgi:hypothetical protein